MEQELKDRISGIQMDILNQVENYELMSQHRASLSSIYSMLSETLKTILLLKHKVLNERKKELQEDEPVAKTNRWWKLTEEGLKEELIKIDLKSVEKMMASLNSLVYVNRTDYKHTR